MKTNIIELWVNLSRAYEIARLGEYNISIVFDKEYIEGPADYKCIKSFYDKVNFTKKGHLSIEICKPYSYASKAVYETLEDIEKRVKDAGKNEKPIRLESGPGLSLLKVATERLNLSLQDIENIHNISITIAQLSNSDIVKVEHLAEAIQYRSYGSAPGYINAESTTVNFGPGIEISLFELGTTEIKEAIKYLTAQLC